MTRTRAFFVHLACSAAVVAGLAAVMLSTWYSRGFLQFSKADTLLGIVAAVDVIVGPLLTLSVFKPGKPKLRFDISCIVILQLAFLGFGLRSVWLSRPVFLVALEHQYVLVFANDIPDEPDVLEDGKARRPLPWFGPELVGATMPSDPDAATSVVLQAGAGRDLSSFREYYLDFEAVSERLSKASKPISELDGVIDAEQRARLDAELSAQDRADLHWVLIWSTRGQAIILVSPDDGRPVRAIPIVPATKPLRSSGMDPALG